MRLADLSPASGTVGAKQITAQINQLMLAAGLRRDELQRTAPDGTVHTDVTNPDVKLIQKDAKYIAETCCGLDLPAMHAMFGAPITETDEQSYRVIPISRELGEQLAARRKKLEVQYGDVSALHMCADPSTPEADTSQEIESYRNSLDRHIPEILRKPEHFDATAARRAYMFDRKKQDNYLRGMLTCHALRREFCTHLLYCRGWSAAERYLQMGHSMRSATTRPLGGKTEDEIYQMCLHKIRSARAFIRRILCVIRWTEAARKRMFQHAILSW